jgi:hypothetical protein
MFKVEILRAQLEALKPLEDLVKRVERDLQERDRLIVRLARQNVPLAMIADVARLTASRVGQIVKAAPPEPPAGSTDPRPESAKPRRVVLNPVSQAEASADPIKRAGIVNKLQI